MPKIIKTNGICLSSRPLRETSKLTTFYTEEFGKITFLCKGARNPKSKFGSALEQFSLSELIFFRNEPRVVYILSDANLIDSFPSFKHHDKFIYASQIVELELKAVGYEDSNHKLFNLIYAALKNLDHTRTKKTAHYHSLLSGYFLKAISLLGFEPELHHCVVCKNPKFVYFSIEKGGVICDSHKHAKQDKLYGLEQIRAIKYLLSHPLAKSLHFSVSPTTYELIQDYLTYHLEKVRLHSLQF
jgi:DNA repair protein RecO (recombination protein O)